MNLSVCLRHWPAGNVISYMLSSSMICFWDWRKTGLIVLSTSKTLFIYLKASITSPSGPRSFIIQTQSEWNKSFHSKPRKNSARASLDLPKIVTTNFQVHISDVAAKRPFSGIGLTMPCFKRFCGNSDPGLVACLSSSQHRATCTYSRFETLAGHPCPLAFQGSITIKGLLEWKSTRVCSTNLARDTYGMAAATSGPFW